MFILLNSHSQKLGKFEILHNPVRVQVGNDAPAHTVSHAFYPVARHLKTALLLEDVSVHYGVGAVSAAHTEPEIEATGAALGPCGRFCDWR